MFLDEGAAMNHRAPLRFFDHEHRKAFNRSQDGRAVSARLPGRIGAMAVRGEVVQQQQEILIGGRSEPMAFLRWHRETLRRLMDLAVPPCTLDMVPPSRMEA